MAEAPVWEPVVAYDRSFDARYGLEMQPDTVPGLLERFGLQIGVRL